jgi:DNA-binding response OmpR family regulator
MTRVLVIEDEQPLRRIITLNLVRRGHTVIEAEGYRDATEALRASAMTGEQVELVLLDINLPDATGWDVLRWLRAHRREMPARPEVAIMTAVRPAEHRLREFGPVALLLKPFPIDALLRLVERLPHHEEAADTAGLEGGSDG